MVMLSDKQIVEGLKDQRPVAYRCLADKFHRRLLREAIGTYRVAHQDAEEIVNDVLMAVLKGIETFEFKTGDSDFQAWMMRILRNRVFDHFRRQEPYKQRISSMDSSVLDGEDVGGPGSVAVLRALTGYFHDPGTSGDGSPGTAARLLAEAVDRLEPWERMLLHCRADEIPYDAIAGYTGKSVQQLKVYHSRVKKKLRKTLQEKHPEHFKPDEASGM
jgi:RNA polymerase sigma factor (sigma-70 family)